MNEFHKRIGDPNLGGASTMNRRVTAYRQRSLAIAGYLKDNGATKASDVAKEIAEPKAETYCIKTIMVGLLKRSRGIYKITALGEKDFSDWV